MTAATAHHQLVELSSRLRAVVSPLERKLRQQAPDRFTPTQLSVLGAIYRHGPLSLSDLAAGEQLSAPTISKAVASLEDAGVILRIPDPDDRRICRVTVSEVGDRWIQTGRAQRNKWLAERMARLTQQDRASLAAAVTLLEQILAEDD